MSGSENYEKGPEMIPGQEAADESGALQWKKVILPSATEEELGEIREKAGLNEQIRRRGKPLFDSRGTSSIGRRR